MRWIEYENKKPTDSIIPGWTPWTPEKWAAWQAKSALLRDTVARLDASAKKLKSKRKFKQAKAKLIERNRVIDNNSSHWGELKQWLLALSHGKCWFTEGKEICSHYDVEHFRPKKEAKGENGKVRDGYWWLAFDYSNFRAAGGVPNTKKGGWFPLHSKSRCSTFTKRCEESEIPYLLDPICPTDPGLLAFDEEGNAIPVPSSTNWGSASEIWAKARALVSIERYKLNDHDALPQARRKVWQTLSSEIDGYLNAKARYHPTDNPAPRQTMEEKLRNIVSMTKPDAQLSSVARWCILFRNVPELLRIAA